MCIKVSSDLCMIGYTVSTVNANNCTHSKIDNSNLAPITGGAAVAGVLTISVIVIVTAVLRSYSTARRKK